MSMGDICFYWDSVNKMIILQNNAIKASFQKTLNVVSHLFNVTTYKKLVGFISKYALQYIVEEMNLLKWDGFDKDQCGYTIRSTHGLPCACELASYGFRSIPLQSVYIFWTRLTYADISCVETTSELSIEQEFDVIFKRFKEVDIAGKLHIKNKLREIAFPDKTSMEVLKSQVKTKVQKRVVLGNLQDQQSEYPLNLSMLMHSIHNMIGHPLLNCPSQ